jgi:hypothetical protein
MKLNEEDKKLIAIIKRHQEHADRDGVHPGELLFDMCSGSRGDDKAKHDVVDNPFHDVIYIGSATANMDEHDMLLMTTNDEDIVLCLDVTTVHEYEIGDEHPAYSSIGKRRAKHLDIHMKLTESDIDVFQQQWACHSSGHEDRMKIVKEDKVVTELVLPWLVTALHDKLPGMFKSLIGKIRKWTPKWIQRGGTRLYDFLAKNPYLIGLGIAIYSSIKMVMCIVFLPGAGIDDALAYIGRKFDIARDTIDAVRSTMSAATSCSSVLGIPTCIKSVVSLTWSSLRIGGVGVTKVFNAIFNVDNSVTTLTDYTSAPWYMFWQSPTRAITTLHNTGVLPSQIESALIELTFPDLGLTVLDWLASLFGSFVPGFNAIVKRIKTMVRESVGSDVIVKLRAMVVEMNHIRVTYRLLSFFVRELYSITKCITTGGTSGGCCFSTDFIDDFSQTRVIDRRRGYIVKDEL